MRFWLNVSSLGLVVSHFPSRSHLRGAPLLRTGRGKRGDKILTCSFLFSRTLATSVSLLSTAVNDVNFVDFNEKERVRDVRFVDFDEKERVRDVRFVKFNEKERVRDVILAKMHAAKCFSW